MRRRARTAVLATTLLASLLVQAPASPHENWPPQVARGIIVPTGFVATVFAQVPPGHLPTSLSWAEDADASTTASVGADGAMHGVTLYVTTISGNLFAPGNGSILTYQDEGHVPTTVATGLDVPLGVLAGNDGTVYVSENNEAQGRGRVTALRDSNGDGTLDEKRIIIKNLPNGRHQTNGLTFGPDGMLYVANGNATDNGQECGPEPINDLECAHPEVKPWSGAILRVNPEWEDVDLLADVQPDPDGCSSEDGMAMEDVLVSEGYRNIYDVDFDPQRPGTIWTPMNGADNPSSSEPIYAVDVENERICRFTEPNDPEQEPEPVFGPVIEDAGFPSCLHDPHWNDFPDPDLAGHDHPNDPEPKQNPHPDVIEKFGPCKNGKDHPEDTVIRPMGFFPQGHNGSSGMAFERGGHFPERYRNDLFAAEWGSLWNLNGANPSGHKVQHFILDDERNIVRNREFMTGGLPIDVTFGPDGRMYVADMTGQIIEVRYVAGADVAADDVVPVDMLPGLTPNGEGRFSPPSVTVVRGQTVRWCNRDTQPHSVQGQRKFRTFDPQSGEQPVATGSEINSPGNLAPEQCHSHTFWDWGPQVYHYRSDTNAADRDLMHGTIQVLPAER